jgi:hypothetical protein
MKVAVVALARKSMAAACQSYDACARMVVSVEMHVWSCICVSYLCMVGIRCSG